MNSKEKPIRQLMESLNERAKELNCLYRVDEVLADPTVSVNDVCRQLVAAIPPGWKYPEACAVRITLGNEQAETDQFRETPWQLTEAILADGVEAGILTVCYTQEKPAADNGPFLKEERKLLNAIAQRVAFFFTRMNLRIARENLLSTQNLLEKDDHAEWNVILDFLRRTDPNLLRRITRRMTNYLELTGVDEAERLLKMFTLKDEGRGAGDNVPLRKAQLKDFAPFSEEVFEIAAKNLGQEKMVTSIRSWIDEERSAFLIEVLEDQSKTFSDAITGGRTSPKPDR